MPRPRQRPNPRLNIPADLERDVLPCREAAADIGDLVFGARVGEVELSGGEVIGGDFIRGG